MAYDVVYRKGIDNKVPDCLSRNPSPPEAEPPYDESVERFSFLSAVEPDLSNLVDWKRAQGDDTSCAELIAYLASKQKKSAILNPKFADVIRRTAHEYVVDNGVLHSFVAANNGRLYRKVKTVRPVVVPVSLQNQVLSEVHDSPTGGGHLGQRATQVQRNAPTSQEV